MKRLVWTAVAIVGALLVETGLSYLVVEPGRYLDPFLLVVVYSALTGGETRGMLAGLAAGWVQDVHFGGEILGLSALSKLLISSTSARALVLLLATVADALLVLWFASVFTIEVAPMSPITLASRASLTAVVGGVLFALVDGRVQRTLL